MCVCVCERERDRERERERILTLSKPISIFHVHLVVKVPYVKTLITYTIKMRTLTCRGASNTLKNLPV